MPKVTSATLSALRRRAEPAVFVTAYDYATAVFASRAQKAAAEASRRAAAARIGADRFVTPVRDASRFWPAEAYHQDFARRNPARYGGYSRFCGRAARLRAVWGDAAA